MRRLSMVSAGLAVVLSLGAATAQAQVNNASVNATANVLQPINVVGAKNLDFGSVLPGLTYAVATNDAGAGRFDVSGEASKNVNLTFTLPASLSGPGANIALSNWVAEAISGPATGASYVPVDGVPQASALDGAGLLNVYVGAQITPATNQAAGAYTAGITLTVDYF